MSNGESEDRPAYRVYRSGDPTDAPGEVRPPPSEDPQAGPDAGEAPPPQADEAPRAKPDGPPGPEADEAPKYRVYRSRRSKLEGLRPHEAIESLRGLRRRRPQRVDRPEKPGVRGPITPVRVLKWLAFALGGWLLLSLVVFFVSAQFAPKVSDRAEEELAGGSSLLTGSTVLVLGSDERSDETREPTAAEGQPSRADSILLVRAGLGSVRRLSILRDTEAQIPGAGTTKINAAYAVGGAALTIETVEKLMGNDLEINHVVEVSFEDFPELIDALGGVEVTLENCLRSEPFGGHRVRLKKGTHRLTGRQALRFARVRKNLCAPNETDLERAARQQEVLRGMRASLLSPGTFLRLPLVSWEAPRAVRSDMAGPGLMALFTDLVTGGAGGKTRILRPDCLDCGIDGSARVSEDTRRREVRRLLGKD